MSHMGKISREKVLEERTKDVFLAATEAGLRVTTRPDEVGVEESTPSLRGKLRELALGFRDRVNGVVWDFREKLGRRILPFHAVRGCSYCPDFDDYEEEEET